MLESKLQRCLKESYYTYTDTDFKYSKNIIECDGYVKVGKFNGVKSLALLIEKIFGCEPESIEAVQELIRHQTYTPQTWLLCINAVDETECDVNKLVIEKNTLYLSVLF